MPFNRRFSRVIRFLRFVLYRRAINSVSPPIARVFYFYEYIIDIVVHGSYSTHSSCLHVVFRNDSLPTKNNIITQRIRQPTARRMRGKTMPEVIIFELFYSCFRRFPEVLQ